MTESRVNVTQTARGFGGLGVIYLVVQVALFAAWIVPGWPLNGTAWGLIFLPTFIYFGLGLIGVILALIFVVGMIVFISKDK